jgi:hypothetical protein
VIAYAIPLDAPFKIFAESTGPRSEQQKDILDITPLVIPVDEAVPFITYVGFVFS